MVAKNLSDLFCVSLARGEKRVASALVQEPLERIVVAYNLGHRNVAKQFLDEMIDGSMPAPGSPQPSGHQGSSAQANSFIQAQQAVPIVDQSPITSPLSQP